MMYCLRIPKKKWGKMHKHIYSAGSIRDEVIRRYCECGHVFAKRGPFSAIGTSDDIPYYKAMAERYK